MLLTGAQAACIAFYDQETNRFKEWVTQGLSEHFVKNMSFRPDGLLRLYYYYYYYYGWRILSNIGADNLIASLTDLADEALLLLLLLLLLLSLLLLLLLLGVGTSAPDTTSHIQT